MLKLKFINLYLSFILIIILSSCKQDDNLKIMTVTGEIPASEMGVSLTHEHVLVDFAGADSVSPNRYNRDSVIAKVLPYLNNIKKYNVSTFVECTPEYMGRDPELLLELSKKSGIKFLTNTGWYGANDEKQLPAKVKTMTAKEISQLWINEAKNGIGTTGIKPGFIKIGINNFDLSETDKKLVEAAALTHLETGLTIMSHTGMSVGAFTEIDILEKNGVDPSAFIWAHANIDPKEENLAVGAYKGAWIAIDGIDETFSNINRIVAQIKYMKSVKYLDHVLLSHDAGWYEPTKPNGGIFRGYNTLFDTIILSLKMEGFTEEDINLLLVKNPARAFGIKVRKFVEKK